MPLPLFVVDAFADRAFAGNPAAVCLLDRPREESWMREVAGEMNLSETAFVAQRADGEFDLRWFTPEVEVALCGHATLATAHVLWESARFDRSKEARFHTKSGVLGAKREGESIALDFPSRKAIESPAPDGLLAALGVSRATWTGRAADDVLVAIESESELRSLAPNFAELVRVEARGIIVTARSDGASATTSPRGPHQTTSGTDFVSRFFGPRVGIDEDPVTGSAHCALAPFWSARLGKTAMTGFQASKRGGVVGVRVEGDRTILLGRAITITRGELLTV